MEYKQKEVNLAAFRKWLLRRNAILSEPLSEDELLRFSTTKGFGVLRQTRAGTYIGNAAADKALRCFSRRQPWSSGYTAESIASQRVCRTSAEKKKLAEEIAARDGGTACAYCGRELAPEETTLEHVIPISRGGPDRIGNMVLACRACNQAMGSASLAEKIRKLKGEAMNKYGVSPEDLSSEALDAESIKEADAEQKKAEAEEKEAAERRAAAAEVSARG